MKLKSGEFETCIDCDGDFEINIREESDISTDGGYTFEDVTNTYWLNRSEAKELIKELQHYINN